MNGIFKALLLTASLPLADGAQAEPTDAMKLLMDFNDGKEAPTWFAVNDGVMGGLSMGDGVVKDGSLVFAGTLSLENNGGFSSVRTEGSYNFEGKSFILMRVMGDGRTYQLRLATDARYQGSKISYAADFTTEVGKWTEVKIPLDAFLPGWRGRKLDGPPLELSEVEEIGILIGDKKTEPFALKVDWIKVG